MRIALNHTYLRIEGGVERYVYRLVQALIEKGFSVDFFGVRGKAPSHRNLRFINVPIVKGSEALKILSFALNSASLIKRGGPYNAIMGFGKTFYHTLYRDGSGLAEDYERFVEKRDPLKGAIIRWIERKRFRFPLLKRVVAVSNMVARRIKEKYGFEDITVLYSAVDSSDFDQVRREESKRFLREMGVEGKVILFAGNGFRRKGLEDLLRILPQLKFKKWCLLVLGKDKNIESFKLLSKRLGVGDRVFFLGFRKDRARFFKGADVFCLPTRFDPIANVVVESLYCGIFTMTTPMAGGSELIKNWLNGIVFRSTLELEKGLEFALSSERRGFLSLDLSWRSHLESLLTLLD